ncbi:hypothetical protein Xszus_04336 [Xenorhabdus szentirmaii]|nr:hypothetical protein Xszus_04336 [Xenorhabdus szentirmaii]
MTLTVQNEIACWRRFSVTVNARGQFPLFLVVQGSAPDIQLAARSDPPVIIQMVTGTNFQVLSCGHFALIGEAPLILNTDIDLSTEHSAVTDFSVIL